MPYISEADRRYVDICVRLLGEDGESPSVENIASILVTVPSGKVKGAFNYFVTRLFCHTFDVKNAGYTQLSDSIAVMVDMEHELRRRVLDPYEDKVIKSNGDLPEFEFLENHLL